VEEEGRTAGGRRWRGQVAATAWAVGKRRHAFTRERLLRGGGARKDYVLKYLNYFFI
jgi:hypothetical protein